MQDQILDMLLKKDEITWQNILYDLVKSEQMDPWDIDISLLAQKYLEIVRKLQEFNFFISGKVILASAILLRLKSDRLLLNYIASFDNKLFANEELEELSDFEDKPARITLQEKPRLTIKTPLTRKRKVSISDLVEALEKALEVDQRRVLRRIAVEQSTENLHIPEKKTDIRQKIKELYQKIRILFSKQEKVTFFKLVNSERKEDKIATFVPLLHLANQERVFLEQPEHFGDINIYLSQNIAE